MLSSFLYNFTTKKPNGSKRTTAFKAIPITASLLFEMRKATTPRKMPTAQIITGKKIGKISIVASSIAPDRKLPAMIAARQPATMETIAIKVLLPLIDEGFSDICLSLLW